MGKDFDYCRNLLKEFVDKKLSGKLDNLKDFNFLELKDCKKYGKCTRYKFDPDDTELARCIYILVWGNKNDTEYYLPSFSYSELGNGKNYGGDTLNTFNTVFGGDGITKEGVRYEKLWQAKKYIDDTSLLDRIKEFEGTVYSIGNFSFLPSIKSGNISINQYRGRYKGWQDFYDKFLEELKKSYEDIDYKIFNKQFYDLKTANNKIYFNTISSISEFKTRNFLDCYFKGNQVKDLFFNSWTETTKNTDAKNYKDFIEHYITEVTKIVKFRANEIVEKLKPLMEC